jgi:small lipoprotein (TIGR04452 family)
MKKLIMLGLVTIWISNCLVINPLGLNVGRERGSEASDRITTAAIRTDLLYSTILTEGKVTGFSIFI